MSLSGCRLFIIGGRLYERVRGRCKSWISFYFLTAVTPQSIHHSAALLEIKSGVASFLFFCAVCVWGRGLLLCHWRPLTDFLIQWNHYQVDSICIYESISLFLCIQRDLLDSSTGPLQNVNLAEFISKWWMTSACNNPHRAALVGRRQTICS